uniref:N-terminal Ras-GEF domain-containing protein n=1 Tax=Oryzias latipes TaxID=8090 RepID=A0A3P9LDE3_ORYLA
KMGSSTLVKAASIDSLLNECIHAFDDSLELHVNLLPRTLLLMHRWYVPSAELAGKLLMIYPTWETHGGAVARTSAGSEFTLDLAAEPTTFPKFSLLQSVTRLDAEADPKEEADQERQGLPAV